MSSQTNLRKGKSNTQIKLASQTKVDVNKTQAAVDPRKGYPLLKVNHLRAEYQVDTEIMSPSTIK